MRNLFVIFVLITWASQALCAVTKSEDTSTEATRPGWRKLDTACYLSSSYEKARKFCEDGQKILSVLSNRDVTFISTCSYADSTCPYGSLYMLKAEVLVLSEANLSE
jgi:hypothetical protein